MYKNFSYISKINIRLDALISACLGISKNKAAKYCDNGFVRVDRKVRKSGYSVKEKSKIVIKEKIKDLIAGTSLEAKKLSIKIAYEDSDLIILEKPSNIHCVRKSEKEEYTIADFLADNYPSSINATENTKESGLINRLDYQTSGLVLAAKNKNTAKELKEIQKQKKIEKTYLAVVRNLPATRVICSGFTHNKDNSVELINNELDEELNIKKNETKKSYTTRITNVEKFQKNLFLLEIKGTNFYRHQIRAHLASIGSALIGDPLYNKENEYEQFFLHSSKIKFRLNSKKEIFVDIGLSSEIKNQWEKQIKKGRSD